MKLFPFLLGTLFFLLIVGGILQHRLLKHLRKNHLKAWIELGSPSFLNNSIKNNLSVTMFYIRKKYLQLDDEYVAKTGAALNILTTVFIFIFVLMGILWSAPIIEK